jgi:predicted O-linked N-acetylglucosamine transferase (SPINDLY family)
MTYLEALKLYPYDYNERKTFLKKKFNLLISRMKLFIKTDELNINKESMTYVFEHIKNDIIKIIAVFVPTDDKVFLESNNWNDIKYRKKVFDALVELENKPLLIWFFFHFNYFYVDNIDQRRKNLMENIEIFYKYYPKHLYFETVDELSIACGGCNPLFSISYQNRNNRVILENYSKLLRKICPSLNYQGQLKKSKTSHIKVCFFSDYLTMDSSVLRDRIGTIYQLPKNTFDVYYMGFTKPENITGSISKTFYNMLKKNYLTVPKDINLARQFIEQQEFDIIVYCEIGMSMIPLFLAYSRLAPIQLTTWGHSETSGIDTIDYYVSSKLFEIEETKAQTHYSEKLYLMDSLSTYYYPPTKILLPPNFKFKSRSDFGLSDKNNVYSCIQSSFKISEEFEKILNGILKGDPNGVILMSTNKPFCKSQASRIYNLLGDKDYKRLLFYPALNNESYMNLIKMVDVALDPYPFGGCNTSFEAFDYNIPVVTMPTKYLNGRFTFGMYKRMGFIDMVADSPPNYIKIALRTGTDRRWRESIKEKISKLKGLLFQDNNVIKNWTTFLKEIYDNKLSPKINNTQIVPTSVSSSQEVSNYVSSIITEDTINQNQLDSNNNILSSNVSEQELPISMQNFIKNFQDPEPILETNINDNQDLPNNFDEMIDNICGEIKFNEIDFIIN